MSTTGPQQPPRGHTRPLGHLPDAPPDPIERTAPMTDLRALELAIWTMQRKMENIQEDAEWFGLPDEPIRYRRTEITQALFKLQMIHNNLARDGSHKIEG